MNKEELFNLRHASARNVIERIFGVLKRRFRILLLSPKYTMDIQARIPAALCAIHNFIRTHDHDEAAQVEAELATDPHSNLDYENPEQQGIPDDELDGSRDMKEARDHIARHMWDDYQAILQERGMLDSDSDEDDIEYD